MKKFANILPSILGVAILFSACSKSKETTQPVELKLKWRVGKRYVNHMSMTQVAHLEVSGMTTSMEQSTSINQDFAMSAMNTLSNGAIQMQMEFVAEKIETKMGDKVITSFDSAADPKTDANNPVAPIMRTMTGTHFGYEITPAGKVGNITGMDEVVARLPAGDEQGKAMFKNMMNDEMVQQLAMRGQGLPDKPVQPGDHWPLHLDENAGPAGVLQMDLQYTFTGWEDHNGHKCVLLDFTGEVSSKPGSSTGPMTVTVEKGALVGKEWFDPELGMVVDTSSDQDMSMKISTSGKNINSQMKQSVSVSLTDVADLPK